MRHLRQALAMMREEKLFSAIHIAGTALAIAFTMVMAVVYYIKLAPIYPEANRARTIYFVGIRIMEEKAGKLISMSGYGFSEKAFEEWFQSSKNVEFCAPTDLAAGQGQVRPSSIEYAVKGKDEYLEIISNHTSADFFKIYEYDFLEGRPFTKQEVEDKEHVCVISDDFVESYFGKGVSAVGKMVEIENQPLFRVVGVVREASRLTPDSYAQLFKPYTLRKTNRLESPYAGMYSIVVTVKDNEQFRALKQELDEIAARLTQSKEMPASRVQKEGCTESVQLTREMETHPMHTLRESCYDAVRGALEGISNWQAIRHFAGILFILLFVPALNLCGIVAGRMERRTAEMGIRKTFGARRSTLLNQVLTENLVLTSIGGIIGLVASWIALHAFRTEILGMFFDSSAVGSSPIVTGEMLFAPLLFVGCFAAILVLNLLSALLPAWLSLRKPIVESMMEKR